MDEKAHGKLADIIQFLSKTNNDEKSVPDEDKYYKDRYVQLKKLCEEFFNCLNAPFLKITDEEISSVLEECFGNNQGRYENVIISVDKFKELFKLETDADKQGLVGFLSNIKENCDLLLRGKNKEEDSYDERSQSNQQERNEEYSQLARVLTEKTNIAVGQAEEATKKAEEATKKADKAAKKADKATKKTDEATKKAENLLTEILTVTGIFTAIIVAVVACYLSYILNRVDELKSNMESLQQSGMTSSPFVNIARLGILACIVLLVAFFMVYLTAKMTDRSIACRPYKCAAKSCDECEKSEACCNLKRFWRRYPYIATILGVLLIFFAIWILMA